MVFFLTTIGGVKLPAYLPILLLVVALVVGMMIARRLWLETHEDDQPASTEELLAEFREAHAAGELDDVEFRRVSELLGNSPASQCKTPAVSGRRPSPSPQAPPSEPAPLGNQAAEDDPPAIAPT